MPEEFFEKRSRIISVRITPSDHEALADLSTEEGVSISALGAVAVKELIQKRANSKSSSSPAVKVAAFKHYLTRTDMLTEALRIGLQRWETLKDPRVETKILELLQLVDFPLPFELPEELVKHLGR